MNVSPIRPSFEELIDRRIDVERALDSLSVQHRRIFFLHEYGYTLEEIAEKLEISQPFVTKRIHEIKLKIKNL